MLRLRCKDRNDNIQEELSCRNNRGYNLRKTAKFVMPKELTNPTTSAAMRRSLVKTGKLTPQTKAPPPDERSSPSMSPRRDPVESEVCPDPCTSLYAELHSQTAPIAECDPSRLSQQKINELTRLIQRRYKVIVHRRKQHRSRILDELRVDRIATIIRGYFDE